jgi:thioredoxin reductase (NADPH)
MKGYDLIIVGGGGAGFAAAMYAGRLNLNAALFTGDLIGGLITWSNEVSNYPGIKKITGIELAKMLESHAREYTKDIFNESVTEIRKSGNGFLVSAGRKDYSAKAIIFATGTSMRKLNVPGEAELLNKGVHFCALCDGYAYKNKAVAVVGGSDSAVKDALILTQYAKKVYIIYRGSKIHPEPVNYDTAMKNKKISVITGANVVSINGKSKVESVILDKGSRELKLDGIFVAIGHVPNSGLAKSLGVRLNDKDEIIIDKESMTNVSGIYAAGDVTDTKSKQLITGIGEAVKAVYSAYGFLNKNPKR